MLDNSNYQTSFEFGKRYFTFQKLNFLFSRAILGDQSKSQAKAINVFITLSESHLLESIALNQTLREFTLEFHHMYLG